VIDGDQILGMLRALVGRGAHQAEAVYLLTRTGMTRFAASRIHQNLDRTEAGVTFRVALEGRIGVAGTGDLRPEGLESCLERALAIARLQKPTPEFEGLPGGADEGGAAVDQPSLPAPARRLELAHGLVSKVRAAGLAAAGSLSVQGGELAVINSEGRFVRAPYRAAESLLIAMDDGEGAGCSGYASWAGHDPETLDTGRMAGTAVDKCVAGREDVSLDPGPVDVLLEPPAVAGLLNWLSYIGFGGKQFNEGTSFLSGRLGDRLCDSRLTIYDDHAEIEGLGLPVDFEGVQRQRVDLVREGKAVGVVHDSLSGARAGTASTGHALPTSVDWGPLPQNLGISAGEATGAGMIASMERGLVVTRFHYLNGLLDTRRALFTGMTRDGTFLVRDGRISGSVANLRFTEPMLEAFSRVAAVSRERQTLGAWTGRGASCTVPSLLIRDFHFDNGR